MEKINKKEVDIIEECRNLYRQGKKFSELAKELKIPMSKVIHYLYDIKYLKL